METEKEIKERGIAFFAILVVAFLTIKGVEVFGLEWVFHVNIIQAISLFALTFLVKSKGFGRALREIAFYECVIQSIFLITYTYSKQWPIYVFAEIRFLSRPAASLIMIWYTLRIVWPVFSDDGGKFKQWPKFGFLGLLSATEKDESDMGRRGKITTYLLLFVASPALAWFFAEEKLRVQDFNTMIFVVIVVILLFCIVAQKVFFIRQQQQLTLELMTANAKIAELHARIQCLEEGSENEKNDSSDMTTSLNSLSDQQLKMLAAFDKLNAASQETMIITAIKFAKMILGGGDKKTFASAENEQKPILRKVVG